MLVKNSNLKKVRWAFDDGNVYDGYTDGSRWNGWINIWMDEKTYKLVLEEWMSHSDAVEEWTDEFSKLTPCESGEFEGLYSIAYGYTPHLINNK